MKGRGRASWTARAFLAWMGLFALFCLAPSNMCEATVTGISLCVSGAPPLGMDFMPMRLAPEDKVVNAALRATEVLAVLLVIAGLIWLVRQTGDTSAKEKGRSNDRPF